MSVRDDHARRDARTYALPHWLRCGDERSEQQMCACVRAQMFVYVRARANVCVRSPGLFARRRVACEELDMSFRGIRHLKREEVEGDSIAYKASHHICPEHCKPMKTSARSSALDVGVILFFLGMIIIVICSHTESVHLGSPLSLFDRLSE